MTGYNHYSDCTCGWCVNYGRSRWSSSARQSVEQTFRQATAEAELRRNGVRSVASCFVNPNATCPECGDRVYFYANEHGSRVFFDHLGPPWPKHPCTDRGTARPSSQAPNARSRGSAHELMIASVTAGRTSGVFGQRGNDEWSPIRIVSTIKDGDRHTVTAEHLNSTSHERTTFWYEADRVCLKEQDLANVKGSEVSFFDLVTFRPVLFRTGTRISFATESPTQVLPPKVEPPRPGTLTIIGKAARTPPTAAITKTGDLLEGELKHFNTAAVNVAVLCGRLLPIIRQYAREGVRKPRDVAKRLNKEGHRTACGAHWDQRLVYFLLKLLFQGSTSSGFGETTRSGLRPTDMVKNVLPAGPLTARDMAERLSSLGRVTVKGS